MPPAQRAQFEALQAADVQSDDFEAITAPEQIMTFAEAVQAAQGQKGQADFNLEDAQAALDKGEITVYSAGPIRTGSFVTPSRIVAQSMTNGRISSTTVPLDSVAWTDYAGGQYVGTEDIYNGGEGNGILPGGGERYDRARAGEQAGELVGRAEETQGGNGRGQAAAARSENGGSPAQQDTEQAVKHTADLGIKGGSTTDSIRLVTERSSEDIKRAQTLADEHGLKLVPFEGGDMHVGDTTARACITNGTIYARTDHPHFSVYQLVKHEVTHDLIDHGEIDEGIVRERIAALYGEGSVQAVARLYASGYKGMTAEQAWTEMVCDAEADMNVFEKEFGATNKVYQKFLDDVKAASVNSSSTERGPPQNIRHFSLEKAIIPSYEELIKKEPIVVIDISSGTTNGSFKQRRAQINTLAKEIIKAPILNKDTDSLVFLTQDSYAHVFSTPGELQLNAAEKLQDFVREAKLTHKEKITHGDTNAEYIYTFFAAADDGSDIRPVKLKVKEYRIGKSEIPKNIAEYFQKNEGAYTDFSKLYDMAVLELTEIEKEDPQGSDTTPISKADRGRIPSGSSTIKVADLLDLVKGEARKYIPNRDQTSAGNDADYLAAVKSGDMETAQRMVDEAAKAAGYTDRMWHGAKNGKNFHVFKGWSFFTKNQAYAERYTDRNPENLYGVYAKIEHPFDTRIDAKARQDFAAARDEYGMSELGDRGLPDWTDGYDICDYIEENELDYDAVVLDEGGDMVDGKPVYRGDSYMIRNSTQIKSADPVTYNDAGNVIPLSERFNPENEDIRFSSMLDPEALAQQNEQLRKDLQAATAALAKAQSKAEYWEGQTKPSAAPSPDATDINRFAKYLVSTNATNLKAKDIAPALTELGEYIMRGGNERDELTFTGVKERAVDIAHNILQNYSELQDSTALSDYKEIRKHIRDWGTIRVPGNDLPPDFKDWKAAHRWLRVAVSTGTDIDMVYKDLSTSWPWIFPPDANYGSDQLYAIAEGVRAAEPAYWNPNDEMMAEATEYLANQIIDGLVNGYVDELGETVEMPIRQAKTYADRMQKKLADQKYDAAQKLEEQKAKDQAQLDTLRAEKNARIEQERERARYDMAYAVHQARLAADERLNNLKAHYKEVQETAGARKEKAKYETRVMKIAKRLQNKKLPTPSRALVNEYAGYIDTEARRLTGKTRNALKELRSLYYDLKSKGEILPDKRIETRWERLDQVQVSDLSIEQLQDLCDGLLYIEHELATAKKEIDSKDRRDVYQKGLQIIGDVRGSSTIKGAKVRHNAIVDFLLRYGLDPRRFIRDITGYVDDNPLYLATERINEGQHTMYEYIIENTQSFNKFMEDKDFMKWLTGKDAAEITIVGGNMETGAPVEAKITPDMRISLYLASKNKSNMRHITSIGGGIKVPDIQLYKEGKIKKAFDDGQIIRLTETGVKRICANMSAQELELANAIYKYFNTTSKNALSGVFEKLKGYMMSTVEDYFPINAVSEFIRQLNDDVKHDASIDNPGWLEDRLDNAVGPVMLYDSTSVVLDAIRKHGQFIGLAIPISDFNKLYNMSGPTFNTLGERIGTTGVKDTIQREWGSNTLAYIDKMLADVQNPYTMSDDATKLLRKVRSNYAGATLTMNAGVALKQAGSYPAAAAVLGWEPLIKALGKFGKVNLEAIKESTPLQDLRSQGYSTPEFGDLKNQGRQLPKALNWIQGVDVLTTRKLWKACVIYMQDNHPEMRPGTAEYKETIGKLYNRVIEETQPNYTPMQRPQILRHENDLLRDVFGMFKTQVYQNFGMLYESVGNLAAKQRQYYVNPNEQTKAKYDEAKKSFGRTSSALLVQAIVVSAMTLAWNALRGKLGRYKDKDKEKVTVGSFLKRFGTDVAGNIFGMIPFGSDVFSAISSAWTGDKWYGFEGVTPSALTDFVSAIGSAIDLAGKSYDAAKSGDFAEIQQQSLKWEKAAETGAKFFGVPAENVMNLIKAIYGNITKTACGKYYGEYLAMLATTPIEGNKGQYYDLLYKAQQENPEAFWEIYNSLIEIDAMASEKKSTVENIDAALKQRAKKAG